MKLLPSRRTTYAGGNKNCENMIIVLRTCSYSLLIASIYRPPNTDVPEFLDTYQSLITKLKSERNCKIVIGLDHNLDFLKLRNHRNTEVFFDMNIDNNLFPCITRPTRVTHSSATLIDNIIVDDYLHHTAHSTVLVTDLSDHLACHVQLKSTYVERQPHIIKSIRRVTKKNIEKLKEDLCNVDWLPQIANEDCDAGFSKFHNKLVDLLEKNIPKKDKRVRRITKIKEPWLTKGISRCSIKQLELYKKTLLPDATKYDHIYYKDYRNCLRKLKRYVKTKYHNDLCIKYKSDTKKLWRVINQASGKLINKSASIHCLNVNGIKIFEKKQIAEEFASFFASIGTDYAKRLKANPNYPLQYYLSKMEKNEKSLFLNPTTKTEIANLVRGLKCKQSCGYDGISNSLLKEIYVPLLEPLCYLFNLLLKEGCVPKSMKQADVIPLYKGNDNTQKITLGQFRY